MALSEDAKGIISEIRSQANTTRWKSEQYSLKAVRADLAKFQGVFEAMQASFAGLDARAAEQSEQAKRAAELAQLSEDERNQILRDEADREKRENVLKNRELAIRERELKKRERDDFKLFGKNSIFGNLLGGAFNIFKQAMFVGITGSVLYELTAGFLERFGVELPTLAEVTTKFADLASSTNWEQLKANLQALSGKDIAAIPATIAAGIAAKQALTTAGDIAQTVTLAKILDMLSPTPDDVDEAGRRGGQGGRSRLSLARIGIAGLVFSAVYALTDPMSDLIRSRLKMTKDELAAERIDAIDVGGRVIQGATVGFFIGGLKGALIGALSGAVFGLGELLVDVIEEDVLDKGIITNEAEDAIDQSRKAQKKLDDALKERARIIEEYGKEKANTMLEAMGLDDDSIEALEASLIETTQNLENTRVRTRAELDKEIAAIEDRMEKANERAKGFQTRYRVTAGKVDPYTGEMVTQEDIDERGRVRTTDFFYKLDEHNRRRERLLRGLDAQRSRLIQQRDDSTRYLLDRSSEMDEYFLEKSQENNEAINDKVASVAGMGTGGVIVQNFNDSRSFNSNASSHSSMFSPVSHIDAGGGYGIEGSIWSGNRSVIS